MVSTNTFLIRAYGKYLIAMAGASGESAAARLRELEQQFVDRRAPVHVLQGDNVLRYFCQPDLNPFYDRTCNNQRVMMQNGGVFFHRRSAGPASPPRTPPDTACSHAGTRAQGNRTPSDCAR